MHTQITTIAAALIVGVVMFFRGTGAVFRAAGFVLQFLFWIFVLAPFAAIRRRVLGPAILRRRINAARLIA